MSNVIPFRRRVNPPTLPVPDAASPLVVLEPHFEYEIGRHMVFIYSLYFSLPHCTPAQHKTAVRLVEAVNAAGSQGVLDLTIMLDDDLLKEIDTVPFYEALNAVTAAADATILQANTN